MGLFYCNLSSFPYTDLFVSLKHALISDLQQAQNIHKMKHNPLSVKQFPWNNLIGVEHQSEEILKIKKIIIKISDRGDRPKFSAIKGGCPVYLCPRHKWPILPYYCSKGANKGAK